MASIVDCTGFLKDATSSQAISTSVTAACTIQPSSVHVHAPHVPATHLCWGLRGRSTHERLQFLVQVVRALCDLLPFPPCSSSHTSNIAPRSSPPSSCTTSHGCRSTSAVSCARVERVEGVRAVVLALVLRLHSGLGEASSERPGLRRSGRRRSVVEPDGDVLSCTICQLRRVEVRTRDTPLASAPSKAVLARPESTVLVYAR